MLYATKSTMQYSLIGCDLCDTAAVAAMLARARIDPTLPTLVLSECVLTYVNPAQANALITQFARDFAECVVVTYEQIMPDDAFGWWSVSYLHVHYYSIQKWLKLPMHLLIYSFIFD